MQWEDSLLTAGRRGINHDIAQDGRVAVLTVYRVFGVGDVELRPNIILALKYFQSLTRISLSPVTYFTSLYQRLFQRRF